MAAPMSSMSMDSLTTRLQSNDPTLRHLYLSSDSISALPNGELTGLIEALSQSHYLRHVYFRNFKLFAAGSTMERLLEAMCFVPQLESLFFHCTEVPLAWLTYILRMNSSEQMSDTTTTTRRRRRSDSLNSGNGKLLALGLRYCKLRYRNQAEFEAFETALRQHTTLQDVCIECCEWQVVEVNNDHNNNHHQNHNHNKTSSFLEAIACIPTLKHVECVLPKLLLGNRNNNTHNNNSHSQRLPATTWQRLGSIPHLQSLRLRNIWVPQDDVALLCHSLMPPQATTNANSHSQHRSYCPLQKLILSCDLGPTSAMALHSLLQDPRCALTQLSLRLDQLTDPDCPLLIARALQQQQQQQNATTTCSKLQHFHLSGAAASKLSPHAKQAFCDMMQTNVSLEFVRLEVADYALQSQIAFYLQLNHKGRRELFRGLHAINGSKNSNNTTACGDTTTKEKELWIRALCQNATHLAALHHFLALNPGFFALAALEVEQQRKLSLLVKRQKKERYFNKMMLEDGIDYDSDGW